MTALADALLRTSALQSGLLSKAASSYEAESADGIFSGILAQSGCTEQPLSAPMALSTGGSGALVSDDGVALLGDACCDDLPSDLAIKSVGEVISAIRVLLSIIKKMGANSPNSGCGENLNSNSSTPSGCEDTSAQTADANNALETATSNSLDSVSETSESSNSLESSVIELVEILQAVQQALQNVLADKAPISGDEPISTESSQEIAASVQILDASKSAQAADVSASSASGVMREIMDLLKSASDEEDALTDVDWNGTKTRSQFADDVGLYSSQQDYAQSAAIDDVAETIGQKLENIMELANSLKAVLNDSDDETQSNIDVVIENFMQERSVAIEEIVTKATQDMKEALQRLQEIKTAETSVEAESEKSIDAVITDTKAAMDNAVFALGDRKKTTDKKSKDKTESAKTTDVSNYQQGSDAVVVDKKTAAVRPVEPATAIAATSVYAEHDGASGLSELSINSESPGTSEMTGFIGSSATNAAFSDALSETSSPLNGSASHVRAAEQVVLQIKRAIKNGNREISMQLQPEGLGKVTVKLEFGASGKVQGTLTADNQQTLNMLKQDASELEKALQGAGLQADSGSLQFNLGEQGQQQNGAGQTAYDRQETGGYFGSSFDGEQYASSEDLVEIGTIIEDSYMTPDAVNIRV